jgi:hypothetical protein
MWSVPAAFVLLLAAGPVQAPVAPPPSTSPRARDVSLAIASGTPAVLPGIAVGVAADLRLPLGRGPLFLAARLQWTDASAANESWVIDHHQFVVAAAAGAAADVGMGRVWIAAGAGASGLWEQLGRHQLERLQAAAIPDATESAFTVGPYAFGEVGVAVAIRGAVRALVAGGPTVTRTMVDGSGVVRVGGMARIGAGYDF